MKANVENKRRFNIKLVLKWQCNIFSNFIIQGTLLGSNDDLIVHRSVCDRYTMANIEVLFYSGVDNTQKIQFRTELKSSFAVIAFRIRIPLVSILLIQGRS